MPASAPYIPSKRAQLAAWAANFNALIVASPATYGLSSADAASITAVYNPWLTQYNLASSPTTKTKSVVAALNTAQVAMLAVLRVYAQQVANNAGVTSANKIALGLNPKTSTPSPVTPPNSNPVLAVLSQNPGVVNFTYRDSQTSPTSKAKPYGVKRLALYGVESATPITDPAALYQRMSPTKSPFQFAFPGNYTRGATWYFAAQWVTQKGGLSPWSSIISLIAT
jgi:hypothetical protein